jgi:hypothetical protein
MNKIDRVKEGARLLQQGMNLLSEGPLSYYLEDIAGSVDYLMARFSPIKEGDRVELIDTPLIDEETAWGWMASKHFLVAGAQGVARVVECGRNGICVYVEFDDQTWIDREGVKRPVSKPSQFMFRDDSLRVVAA